MSKSRLRLSAAHLLCNSGLSEKLELNAPVKKPMKSALRPPEADMLSKRLECLDNIAKIPLVNSGRSASSGVSNE
jgi:hypothetical protein